MICFRPSCHFWFICELGFPWLSSILYITTSMKRSLLREYSSGLCWTYGQKLFLLQEQENKKVAEQLTVAFFVVTPCSCPKAFQGALSEQELVGTGRTCNRHSVIRLIPRSRAIGLFTCFPSFLLFLYLLPQTFSRPRLYFYICSSSAYVSTNHRCYATNDVVFMSPSKIPHGVESLSFDACCFWHGLNQHNADSKRFRHTE